MIRIAVDGMGGDFAPRAIVQGAQAIASQGIAEVVLVGDETLMKPFIHTSKGLHIVHTPVFVEMDESPSTVLRKKKDSSINKAFALHKNGDVQAVVSAGNSGATMAFATFTLGRIAGVDRPAIAVLHPTIKERLSILIDGGGTVDCKPTHFVQFALMGEAFARVVQGIQAPRVGVLSNGEEETKGNELTRESHALLKNLTGIHYIGYVEGGDIANGKVDVIVTDGFVGNIALKVSEGIAELFLNFFKKHVVKSLKYRVGYYLLRDIFGTLKKMSDYAETGGAALLGVDGVCIICHGKSNERAMRNAILLAKRFAEKNVNESIQEIMLGNQSLDKAKEK
ncbi:MAG TPA: phosphate acyltransferase PlsX [Syntrophorhabdaceae bacterium]|nr:phosphate acyltransferase PlsX [Syntrophorhabdaceae bacterium]